MCSAVNRPTNTHKHIYIYIYISIHTYTCKTGVAWHKWLSMYQKNPYTLFFPRKAECFASITAKGVRKDLLFLRENILVRVCHVYVCVCVCRHKREMAIIYTVLASHSTLPLTDQHSNRLFSLPIY